MVYSIREIDAYINTINALITISIIIINISDLLSIKLFYIYLILLTNEPPNKNNERVNTTNIFIEELISY